MLAEDSTGGKRGWGALELLNQQQTGFNTGAGPSGSAFIQWQPAEPEHTFADSYCVEFDFRMMTDLGFESGSPDSWDPDPGDEVPISVPPDSSTGDGFTVAFFDRNLTDGIVFDGDWPTEGGWGGGWLGAVGFDGTAGEELGWVVEFDTIVNDTDVSSHDPPADEAHMAVSRVVPSGVNAGRLDNYGRLHLDTVNSAGTAGTTNLDAPTGALPTRRFNEYADSSVTSGPDVFDPAIRDAGWHHVRVAWNPRREVKNPGSPLPPVDSSQTTILSTWIAGHDETGAPFSTFMDPTPPVPPEGTVDFPHGKTDASGDTAPVIIGLTAGKAIAQSSFEVDNLSLICGPCNRHQGWTHNTHLPDDVFYDGEPPPWAKPPPWGEDEGSE